MSPLLSIIIPCYNNGKYLVEMIKCLRHQTSPYWELIVVDDGSTDNTPQVVCDYISDLPNAFFLKRERQPKGSVVCRNIGFEHSKGKYVCHLDADDLVSPTFVEHRVAFMENHPDVDYASFPAKNFSNPNELPDFYTKADTWGVGDESVDLLQKFLSADYPFSVWNNIYRKEKINDLQWDEKVQIYTDFSFIIPCILAGLKHSFSGLEEIDYYYRVSHSSKTMTSNIVSQAKCDSTVYLFRKTIDELKEHNLFDKYKNCFFNFILIHFERLLMGATKENVESFITMCSNYYHCKNRFEMIAALSRIPKTHGKHFLIRLGYSVFWGKISYMKIFIKSKNK